MNIIYDQQIFGSQVYGGISRYIYELALEMQNIKSQDVRIVSPFYINNYLKQAPELLRVSGLPIKPIPKTGRIIRTVNSILAQPIISYFHPDIVHETYYSSKRIASKNSKVVLTVYDMIHEKFRDHILIKDKTSSLKKMAVEHADHVICISEQTRRDLIELFDVNPAKTSVVHLGFTLTTPINLEQHSNVMPSPFLLYVGNRSGYKNFEGLLKAYAASSLLRSHFDLICFGGGKFTRNEKNLFQHYGLSLERVRYVSGDDTVLAMYYKWASAFIYPSLYEGFGIPPLEAMSFNCPVVCSDVSSIPEVVGNAAQMFDPTNPESIRESIERVVSDDELQQYLIAKGRDRIKLFSWRRCAQETLAIYTKVLA